MSTQLVRPIRSVPTVSPNRLRVPRAVERAIDAADHRALVAAAHVRGAGYVTHVALEHAAALTGEEELLSSLHPEGEPRFRLIVDRFVASAATEIVRMGL